MLISHGWEFVEQEGIRTWAALCALRIEERVTIQSERVLELWMESPDVGLAADAHDLSLCIELECGSIVECAQHA